MSKLEGLSLNFRDSTDFHVFNTVLKHQELQMSYIDEERLWGVTQLHQLQTHHERRIKSHPQKSCLLSTLHHARVSSKPKDVVLSPAGRNSEVQMIARPSDENALTGCGAEIGPVGL